MLEGTMQVQQQDPEQPIWEKQAQGGPPALPALLAAVQPLCGNHCGREASAEALRGSWPSPTPMDACHAGSGCMTAAASNHSTPMFVVCQFLDTNSDSIHQHHNLH
jgi:hypothetical protein